MKVSSFNKTQNTPCSILASEDNSNGDFELAKEANSKRL